MAVETRINARYLAEIEDGAGFSLPPVYLRTFVRTYARALGIDPETLPAAMPAGPAVPPAGAGGGDAPLIASGPPVDEVTTGRLGRNPFAEKSQLRTMVIVVALLLTALVFSVKWFGSGPGDPPDGTQAGGPDTASPRLQDRLPAFAAGEGAGAGTGPGSPRDSLVLVATTTESVWVHIVLDNDSSVEYTLPPGYAITLRAKDNFLLAVGNPAGLSISLNGRKMGALGPGNRPVKNVFLSRKSLAE
jgi:hypothetical protein